MTLLQSWSQGAQVWGPTGMRKLWGASNVRVYGGGAAEQEFLSDLEKLIGEYNRLVASPSAVRAPGGGSTSTSWQLTPTPILTVADLAALPRERIIVMPSGSAPVLAQADLLVEHPPGPADPRVDRHLRPTPDPRPTPQPTGQDPVDDAGLTGNALQEASPLAGVAPLVEQTVSGVLEQHGRGWCPQCNAGRAREHTIRHSR